MNYIAHLNSVLNYFLLDQKIIPAHVSLYMALFREWNGNRFPEEFHIKRKLIMKAAKLGSNTTYHRCINDLHNYEYIQYYPSHDSHTGTLIRMANFTYENGSKNHLQYNSDVSHSDLNNSKSKLKGSKVVPLTERYNSNSKQLSNSVKPNSELYSSKSVPLSYKKHIKDKSQGRPFNKDEVIFFFLENEKSRDKAIRFFRHYEQNNWMTARDEIIKDWKSVAKFWIANEFPQKEGRDLNSKGSIDYLKTKNNKNYGEPL